MRNFSWRLGIGTWELRWQGAGKGLQSVATRDIQQLRGNFQFFQYSLRI